jgi:hypothetical protein
MFYYYVMCALYVIYLLLFAQLLIYVDTSVPIFRHILQDVLEGVV